MEEADLAALCREVAGEPAPEPAPEPHGEGGEEDEKETEGDEEEKDETREAAAAATRPGKAGRIRRRSVELLKAPLGHLPGKGHRDAKPPAGVHNHEHLEAPPEAAVGAVGGRAVRIAKTAAGFGVTPPPARRM